LSYSFQVTASFHSQMTFLMTKVYLTQYADIAI